jgi:hypothetical protein
MSTLAEATTSRGPGSRVRRRVALVAAVAAFLVVSALVARWLGTEGTERAAVVELIEAQGRGDTSAVLAGLDCGDERCTRDARANARRLRVEGDVEIIRYDSATARALSTQTGPTRVVWRGPGRLPTVQCVLVRRDGNPAAGTSVTLLRLSTPIDRESSCR